LAKVIAQFLRDAIGDVAQLVQADPRQCNSNGNLPLLSAKSTVSFPPPPEQQQSIAIHSQALNYTAIIT